MRCQNWPFRPRHITCDGDSPQRDQPTRALLTGPGIITNGHLQGIQSLICHNLKYPTTILEFSPAGIPVRTDSPFLNYQTQPACGEFRRHCVHGTSGNLESDAKLCKASDICHAQLFWDPEALILSPSPPSCATESACFAQLHRGEPKPNVDVRTRYGRTFLSYDCPLLGYREALFPIVVEGSAVGMFFLGQIGIEEKREFILGRMFTLLERQPECFDAFLLSSGLKQSKQDILAGIIDTHNRWSQRDGVFLTQADYEKLLEQACNELTSLELLLHEDLEHQRQRYIGARVSHTIARFRKTLPGKVPSGSVGLERLWHNVQECIAEIVKDFSLRYIVVFGLSRPTSDEQSLLDVVASTGSFPPGLEAVLKDGTLGLDLTDAPELLKHQVTYTSSDREPQLLHLLRGCELQKCGDIILVFVPVPHHPQSSIAILVGYTDANPHTNAENAPGTELDLALQSFDTLVVSSLSAILATIAQRQTRDQLRILGHEAGQIIAGLDWVIQGQLTSTEKLRGLTDEEAGYLCRDLEGFKDLLHLLFQQVRLLTQASGKIKPQQFMVLGELLYKWKSIYRLESEVKGLQFVVPPVIPSDRDRPKLYGDRKLVEQLLYNLVNNAVKYCHRGTKIHIDCKTKDRGKQTPHVLSVTNYGKAMPATQQVYDLYWRGDETEQGLGVGLFLAETVSRAHGGSIHHECEQVSAFNIPLIEPYLACPFRFAGEPAGRREALRTELDRLTRLEEVSRAVSRDESNQAKYRPLLSTMISDIERPTYRVTVSVELPRKGETKQ